MAWSSRIRLLLFQVFIMFIFSGLLQGQEKLITGTVTDTAGVAVIGATVYIPSLGTGTICSEDGSFRLRFAPGGIEKISLRFSSVGYVTDTVTLDLNGTLEGITIRLVPVVTTIDGVEIRASRPDNITVINIPTVAGAVIPAVAGGIEAAIATLPGVSSFSELSSGYSVRGGSYDENLVYINDVEVYRPFLIRTGQQEGLSRINPDLTASVNFSPGGFSAAYGDRMSSVLDITYREPVKREGSLSLSMLTSSAHAGVRSSDGRLWFIAGGRYRSNAILLGSLDERGAYRPHFADIQATGGFKADNGVRLTLSLWGSANRYAFIPQSRTTTFGTVENAYRLYAFFEGGEQDRYDSGGGAMAIELRHSNFLVSKFIFSANIAGEYENYDIRGAYNLFSLDKYEGTENQPDTLLNAGVGSWLAHARNTYRSATATVTYRGSAFPGRNGLEWGATASYRGYNASRNEWLRVDSAGYTLRDADEGLALSSRTDLSVDAGSLTAAGWIIGKTGFLLAGMPSGLNAGIRATYDTYSSELLVSPRVSIRTELTSRLSLYVAAGAYHQPPGGRELMAEETTDQGRLKAQRSYHLTAGARFDFTAWNRPFRLTAEAWGKRFDRLIPYQVDNVRVVYYNGNTADGYSAGLDMRINGEFVPGVESWFSLSLMKSEMQIPSLSSGRFPAPFDQRVHASIFFQDYLPSHPDFRAHINIAFGTGIPTSPPGRQQWDVWFRMPPYRRIDIGFSKVLINGERPGKKSFIKEMVAGFEIFNLADIRNTISYTWIRTIRNSQGETREFAVPNYLTRRSLNLKLTAQF